MMIHNQIMKLLIYKMLFKRKRKNQLRIMKDQMPIKDLLSNYPFSVNLMILISFGDIS